MDLLLKKACYITGMIQTIDDFYTEVEWYVAMFDAFVERHQLVGKSQADHICYKCGSKESFERIRALFETESEYMYQSIISKRRIACIRFKKGIETSLGTIVLLELSDQKPNGSHEEGFDHIEVYPTKFSYDQMIGELEKTEQVIKVARPHHTTHDINIAGNFLFRCTHGPLIEKIKTTEMV